MRAEHDRHQHGGLPRKISEPNVQDFLLISAPPSQELQVEMILIIMEKSTAILYWFYTKKKRCFVTIKIIFWLSVHNYLIVFHAETVSSCKRIWKQFQYLIWFLLYLSEVYNFIGMDVDFLVIDGFISLLVLLGFLLFRYRAVVWAGSCPKKLFHSTLTYLVFICKS